jgi:hypothetical protein
MALFSSPFLPKVRPLFFLPFSSSKMTEYFSIGDNSFHLSGFPWIARIVSGMHHDPTPCPVCGRVADSWPEGDLRVALQRDKGNKWPDALGCGVASLLIVSHRILEAWRIEGISDLPVGGRILIEPPLPAALRPSDRPEYLWLDGRRMVGATLDDEASGFVGVRFCETCDRGTFDVIATYDRQHAQPWSYVFVEGSWNGMNVFTTRGRSAGGHFFCTDKVLACASKYRHSNFRFIPAEEGDAPGSRGVEYM